MFYFGMILGILMFNIEINIIARLAIYELILIYLLIRFTIIAH